jgi:NAD(P)H-hydrate epimerase
MADERSQAVTAAQMRDLEHCAIMQLGMPEVVLMERAALACAERLGRGDFDLGNCVCLCGTGNNGGDGMAIARLLHLKGHVASIAVVGEFSRISMDAIQQLSIAKNHGVPVTSYSPGALAAAKPTTIVDAVFGHGLSRPVQGDQLAAINEAGALALAGCKILSVDIPSGIFADTGAVLGAAIKADATVTFAFNKRGLTRGAGLAAAGEITVADIGVYDFSKVLAPARESDPEEQAAGERLAADIAPIASHVKGLAAGLVADYETIVNAIVEGSIDDPGEIDRHLGWIVEFSHNEQMRGLFLKACRSLAFSHPDIVARHIQLYRELYG